MACFRPNVIFVLTQDLTACLQLMSEDRNAKNIAAPLRKLLQIYEVHKKGMEFPRHVKVTYCAPVSCLFLHSGCAYARYSR
jgi:hypothetical protein